MSVNFFCTGVISLALVMTGGSVFTITVANCSKMFIKLGDETTDYETIEHNNNLNKYISKHTCENLIIVRS